MFEYDYCVDMNHQRDAHELRRMMNGWGSQGWRLASTHTDGELTFFFWERAVVPEPKEMLA